MQSTNEAIVIREDGLGCIWVTIRKAALPALQWKNCGVTTMANELGFGQMSGDLVKDLRGEDRHAKVEAAVEVAEKILALAPRAVGMGRMEARFLAHEGEHTFKYIAGPVEARHLEEVAPEGWNIVGTWQTSAGNHKHWWVAKDGCDLQALADVLIEHAQYNGTQHPNPIQPDVKVVGGRLVITTNNKGRWIGFKGTRINAIRKAAKNNVDLIGPDRPDRRW